MAEVNIQKRSTEQEGRQAGGLARRGGPFEYLTGFPSLWRSPFEFISNPFAMMRRMTEEMDRMLATTWPELRQMESQIWPPLEITEQAGQLKICVDLPGVDKNDVKVELSEGNLIISGERRREREEESGGVRRSERMYGSFYRSIPLPEGAQADEAKARFRDGVLEVTIPVPESQGRRTIPIEGQTAGERKQVAAESAAQGRQTKAV